MVTQVLIVIYTGLEKHSVSLKVLFIWGLFLTSERLKNNRKSMYFRCIGKSQHNLLRL